MRILLTYICTSLLFSLPVYSQSDEESEIREMIEQEAAIPFDNIREILKNDLLDDEAKKKVKKKTRRKVGDRKRRAALYNIPDEQQIWSFMSEMWLVQKAPVLKWDFEKPDYGLDISFSNFLEKIGYFEKKFKILLLDTPEITHMALPSSQGEWIFLLSVPFIRTMDLTKLEISILLFEDALRLNKGHFRDYVTNDKFIKQLGTNFFEKALDTKDFKNVMKKYDEFVFKKGFSFQQQFEVTMEMNRILKSDLKLWNTYRGLLQKIDELTKTNILYKNYGKVYPSPELQINWLTPKKEVI